jgi:hypothetical protein
MPEPILVARHGDIECHLLPGLANRHGLITGATGTGKTITLQTLAENFSKLDVPVFMADVKGDLTGISQKGVLSPKLAAVLKERGLAEPEPTICPTTLWDVFGEQGHPVRATVSDMGPLLLARMLALNETQQGVLSLVFKIADDHGLALLDLKDLRAMLQYVGDNASEFQTDYGNVSAASVGAIQRGILQIDEQGGDKFFGEPMLNIADFMQSEGGKGVINILAADKLMNAPRLYATFLLWMLSELFEQLPEVGDLEKPKLVFFFDEAHLLFKEAPTALVERIELVVRLVRSKGVGVYFVTQNPLDIPDTVLAQLGNRVQHALRAFTPRDQKAVKAAATTMRANPKLDIETAITELAVGEALVSFLDAKGRPSVTERVRDPAGQPDRPDHAGAAQGADRRLAGGRRVREDGRPRVGLRKAQGPRRAERRRGQGHGQRGRERRQGEQAAARPGQPAGAAARRRRRHAGRPEGRAVRLHRSARRQARGAGRIGGALGDAQRRLGSGPRDHPRRARRHPRRRLETPLTPGFREPQTPSRRAGRARAPRRPRW